MRPALGAAAIAAVLTLTACTAPAVAHSLALPSPAAAASSYQFGIDLDFYWHSDQDVTSLVTADAGYARGLGANSVLISFPFYTDGVTAAAGAATPPLTALRAAVAAAAAEGLTVGVRPLLDEANLKTSSRTKFQPVGVTAWLDSYQQLIVPYARAAQQAGATRFYIGAELSQFAHDPGWQQVAQAIRAVFKGQLYFSANWVSTADTTGLAGSGGPDVSVAVDAYQGMPVPISEFNADWAAKATVLPRGTVMSEVGIAARWGAQWKPYVWAPSDAPLDPQLQAGWFSAACDAVKADHLGGIYFWSVTVGKPLDVPPSPWTANQFTDSPGATAIKACFTMLGSSR
jgi:Glycoside Hydrolase Family 113